LTAVIFVYIKKPLVWRLLNFYGHIRKKPDNENLSGFRDNCFLSNKISVHIS